MDRFGVELNLGHVAEAREKWRQAYLKFKSECDFVLARLLNEAALNRMSVEQIAKALRMEPSDLRDLMRTHRLDPNKTKTMLAKDAAEALQENAALLGIEPWEMDLMSPLMYLPMGSELRQALREAGAQPEREVRGLCPEGHGELDEEWACRVCTYHAPEAERVSGNREVQGFWRHRDGTPCSSYPDRVNFTYVGPDETVECPHGIMRCYTRDEL